MTIESLPISIPWHDAGIQGDLTLPERSSAIVVFVHGSASDRHGTPNKHVAHVLNDAGMATLLIDLLTADEEAVDSESTRLRFYIDLLTERLSAVTNWLRTHSATAKLQVGYFAAGTGAAAALVSAANHPENVQAIVCSGGRPDLAETHIRRVRAPTLLIVGGNDPMGIEINRQAAAELRARYRLEIIPAAGHSFEEPGALDHTAILAQEWFEDYLILTNHHAA